MALSTAMTTHVYAAQTDIIYEYEIINQKKGQAFPEVLQKAKLSSYQTKLILAIPIYHEAKSDRQLRLSYALENGKRLLREVKVTRGNRMVNFVLEGEDGNHRFVKKDSLIPVSQRKKTVKLESVTPKKVAKPQAKATVELQSTKPTLETTKTAVKRLQKAPKTWYGRAFVQRKGQPLNEAWQVARLSQFQKFIINSGDFVKEARSDRVFTLYFDRPANTSLLKGVKVTRGASSVEYVVQKVDNRYQLVSLKTLPAARSQQLQSLFSVTKVKKLYTPKSKIQLASTTKATPAKVVKKTPTKTAKTTAKKPQKPTPKKATQRSSGGYSVMSFTQKANQSLSKAMRAVKLSSIQRELVGKMPASTKAQTTRRIHLLFKTDGKEKLLRAMRIVRGKRVAEYVLVKYKGQWVWGDEKGRIKYGSTKKSSGSFARYPVKSPRISSGFNLRRRHPITRRIRPHKGTDFKAPHGTPIYAPYSGVVIFSGRQRGYGITLEINHGNGYRTKYAHLSRIMKGARKGNRVKKGQFIARIGTTGLSTGAHLHYEVIVNGRHRNPMTVKLPGRKSSTAGSGTKVIPEAKMAARILLPKLRKMAR